MNTTNNKVTTILEKKKSEKQTLPQVYIVRLNKDAMMPSKADFLSIGYDMTVPADTFIGAHQRIAIPMGIAVGLPAGFEAKIEPRSGNSLNGVPGFTYKKEWMGLSQNLKEVEGRFDADVLTGKIDPGYKGEVHVILRNNSSRPFYIRKGTRIAQITFYRVYFPNISEVSQLRGYDRGGGFGHTDNRYKTTQE